MKRVRWKNALSYIVLFLLVPAVVAVGALVFPDKTYAWITAAVAVLSCLPPFLHFERGKNGAREVAVLAVLVALTAVGRFVFAWLPAFKPVCALVILTGMWLGGEAGFVVGSLSAVLSNFYFGQGPWTPFQMFAFGLIGFLAGVFRRGLKKSVALLLLYGAVSGLVFSLIMDVWTALWTDNAFLWSRYLALLLSALPFTAAYCAANVVFLSVLFKPVGYTLGRLRVKYGLFSSGDGTV